MKRRKRLLGSVLLSLLLLGSNDTAYARPGGGSSFKGGGSRSSGSSSSPSRSSSSSSGSRSSSSSSGSRSSGSSWGSRPVSIGGTTGSGSRSSGGGTPRKTVWAFRDQSGALRAREAPSPGASIYAAPAPHAPIPIGPDTTSTAERVAGFVFGAGFFAVGAGVLAAPMFLIGLLLRRQRKRNQLDVGWSSAGHLSAPMYAPSEPEESPAEVRRKMERLRGQDPDFSVILLEDFITALYAEAHTARGSNALEKYSPYLRPTARTTLGSLPRVPVTTVIVGSLRLVSFVVDTRTQQSRLVVELESNYTEDPQGAPPTSLYALERWTFVRALGARSRSPDRVRSFVCPNCGAPLERTTHGRCTYCSQAVDSGQFDWVVERIDLLARETRGPMLTGTTEEEGTELPTVFDPGLSAQRMEMARRDASFTESTFFGRVQWIFTAMQHAWTSLEWNRARPCLTDRLWRAQSYWIDAYRQQGLRNVTENARILRIELVRIASDRWYEAATVRVHATGLDYTIRVGDNAVVGGRRNKERAYTEYWTLVRSATQHGPTRTAPACPQCGATLTMEMAERCGYCGTLVEASTFDWVLSRIEQDEAYAG
ncbi:TIM44-like domain-containing protein [Polyangium sorediatum]|uniref:TIM44-like domain-containing protein n=1 Tax=Polyangium sorediatum TaxID=889274 RepID=A0ABT6NKY6_9BACT|nr:TIM44-like domain-containing protein [Polyangium sorediatum]MDI1428979.1 TIM44-like domain-containing protein [Polyangium sorediatum]